MNQIRFSDTPLKMTTELAVNLGDTIMQNCFDNNNAFAFSDFAGGSLCGSPEEDIRDSCCPEVGYGTNDQQPKKSANMTECVHVPSSEHVAEIVGRQGCKIKALRSKTNTYIKTPARGEQSVFVVTGRQEDVTAAKKEIISAADHFSQIRASRRHQNMTPSPSATTVTATGTSFSSTSSSTTDISSSAINQPPCSASGNSDRSQVTIGVRVPDNVVGLVVGPKGATIKRIQQDTDTYIVTPGRNKDPVFEVIGSKENVEAARREIESYIETRVGVSGAGSVGALLPDRSYGQCNSASNDYSANTDNKNNSNNFKMADNSAPSSVYDIGVFSSQPSTSGDLYRQLDYPNHSESVSSSTTSPYSPYSSSTGVGHAGTSGLVNQESWANPSNNLIPSYPYSFLETDRWCVDSSMPAESGNNFESNRWEKFLENSINTQDVFINNLPSLLEISLQLSGVHGNGWLGETGFDHQGKGFPDGLTDLHLNQAYAKQGGHVESGWSMGPADNRLWNDLDSQAMMGFGNETLATRVKSFLAPGHHLQNGGLDCLNGLSDFDGRSLSYTPSSSPTESSASTGSAG